MSTKKDYKAIAEIIKNGSLQNIKPTDGSALVIFAIQKAGSDIAQDLADYFATQNLRFNRQKFLIACEGYSK